jgi:hypothetical protein
MARTYKRDSRGRFASGGGGGGRPAARGVSRGTNRLTRDNAGRITSVGGNGATARGGRLRTASGKQRATVTARGIGKAPAGTVSRSGGRAKAAKQSEATVMGGTSRVPAAQRPGSMTNTLRSTLQSLAQADARRIREIEAITGQPVRAPRRSSAGQGATVRAPGRRSVSGTLRDNLRALAQSDARTMRGMADLTKPAPAGAIKGGTSRKALKASAKALPAAKPAAAAKPAKSPRTPRIKVKTVTMWHGTTPAAASKIRKGGFRESKDGVYGDGVYAGTKAVARQYGRASVAIRIPAFKIKDASGSSRQIRALANQLTPSGKVVRWQHPVADRPKQSAFTLSTADANKYRQRIRGSGRRLRISS